MTNRIAIQGQALPFPQFLYPSQLFNTPVDVSGNEIGIPAGGAVPIPTGSNEYLYSLGEYCLFQYQDPITGIWRGLSAPRTGTFMTMSNGVNLRVANLTGCPVAASVANGGSGYTQATATITASIGGSTWQPIVGGSLSVSTINAAGSGYTVPPLVLIPAPPSPGIAATAHATLTGTSVTTVTLDNIGAGYTSVPTAVIVPSPFDPNVATITNATITLIAVAANVGKITGALCTNNGAPLATISALTLTPAGGAGTGATITPQVLQTVTSASVVAGGAGWGVVASPAKVMSVGGFSTASEAIVNPSVDLTGFRVRQIEALGTTNAGGTITAVTINDHGLFLNVPTAAVASGGTLPTTLASITFATGSAFATVLLQPL